MPRPQFSLKTILWLMVVVVLLAMAAAAIAWIKDFEVTMGRGYEERRRQYEERERRSAAEVPAIKKD